ncbi:LysR family transcriptional regulator [Afipia sp. GAS231]|uniref:LysR family transcriptional regulator n=1 Tax=Afipia sp. GAS231 TaxID=1882747 RepID=UPI001FCD72A8|nr:LysR family transcriptional regulator [Afipia sp. GAS231]
MIRRCGSIRGAARHLNVTASAANRQLLALEMEVGEPLFERLNAGLKLTAAGEIFADHVTNVLQDAQRLKGDLDSLRGLQRGSLNIMAVEGLQLTLMSTLATQMLTKYPLIELKITAGSASEIFSAVANGDADAGIGFTTHRNPALRQAVVARFGFVAILAPKHPLASKRAVTFAECARYPLILPTPNLSLYGILQPALKDYALKVVLQTGSVELMRKLAGAGLGIAFSPRVGTGREAEAGKLVQVPLKTAKTLFWEMGVYVRAGRSPPPALDAFLKLAAAEIELRQGRP